MHEAQQRAREVDRRFEGKQQRTGWPALRLAQRVPKIHSLVAVAIEAATTDGLIRREVCPLTSGCAARLIKA